MNKFKHQAVALGIAMAISGTAYAEVISTTLNENLTKVIENQPERNPITEAQATELVKQAYCRVLERTVDESGLVTYRQQLLTEGWSVKDVVRDLALSDEHRIRFYDGKTAEQFVTTVYDHLLARQPDAGGFNHWVNMYNKGLNWQEVVNTILVSQEYDIRFGNDNVPGDGRDGCDESITEAQATELVKQAYCRVLERTVDESGLVTYRQQLLTEGWSVKDVVRDLALSDEHRIRFYDGKTAEQFVTTVYDHLLARQPDAGGFNHWVNMYNKGLNWQEVVDTILVSQEYDIRFGNDNVPGDGRDGCDESITPAAACMLYGVQDQNLHDSIFFVINPQSDQISQIGEVCEGCDIEAMDAHPETGILYVASSDRGYQKGFLYQLDAMTGQLVPVGATGFLGIEGLSFDQEGVLLAWANSAGLVQLDIQTGSGTLVFPSNAPLEVEGLTFNQDSSLLYAAVGTKLWSYEPATGNLALLCDNLPQETEALEVLPILPDGFVLIGMHKEDNNLLIFDVNNCQKGAIISITSHYDDPEGLTMLPVCPQ